MFSDQIERIKRQYTDKYVVVDAGQPELARFRDVVGRVKTVNMNGQALVEFDDYHLNVGWYDINPEFLKVIDKPPPKPPKPEAKKAPVKPAAAAKPQPKAAPAASAKAGKGSVADILAAARAGKSASSAAKPKTEAAPAPEKQEAAGPAQAQAGPKVDRSKMSVADMLAAARAGSAAGVAQAIAKSEAAPAPAKTRAEEPSVQEETVKEEPAAEAVLPDDVPAATEKTIQRIDKSGMSIDDILAYCRQHDAK